ncbi:hypothetical protein [Streptomyces katrae]|uniref:hypothetical protein n=1 Tax=Streptomyces katrae TaxID=68223 RepID=UPI000698D14F|nr:hypothetical protein [Streptomyces katrae]
MAAFPADGPYDVLVLGEVLVEIHAEAPLREAADGTAARISTPSTPLPPPRPPGRGPHCSRSSARRS